jgi:hypothetical protein
MEVDPPTFAASSSSCQRQEVLYTLLRDNHIKFEDDREKKIYKQLKDQEFTLTPIIDLNCLQSSAVEARSSSRQEYLCPFHKEPEPKVSR